MMQHAIETGLRADDPTRDIKAIIVKTDGHHTWSESEIEQFEERHAIGSRAAWHWRSSSTPDNVDRTLCGWAVSTFEMAFCTFGS